MLSTDREFHFIGELKIKKSRVLPADKMPKDDEVNWMFIELDETNRCGFVYKIEDPNLAKYNIPFAVRIAITFYDLVKDKLELNKTYSVMRGEEKVGIIKLIQNIENSQ